jgi:hypothetical protein
LLDERRIKLAIETMTPVTNDKNEKKRTIPSNKLISVSVRPLKSTIIILAIMKRIIPPAINCRPLKNNSL